MAEDSLSEVEDSDATVGDDDEPGKAADPDDEPANQDVSSL